MTSLLELPHKEACRRAASGSPVFVTVNPVEYHGPHLSLHNDRLISMGQAPELFARLQQKHPDWEFLTADDVEMGMEPCLGPGTRLYPYATVKQVVLETARALTELGVTRVVFLTFHGAPLHNMALDAGVRFLEDRGVRAVAPFSLVLKEMIDFKDGDAYAEAVEDIPVTQRQRILSKLNLDFHAGFFETSMSLHYAAHSVAPDYTEVPPCPAWTPDARLLFASRAAAATGSHALSTELAFAAEALGWRALKPFPGYTGSPSLASAKAGAFFARHIMDRYVPLVDAVLHGSATSPTPIMRWIENVSFGGRLNVGG